MQTSRQGLVYGFSAYALWGTVPLYWKLFRGVWPGETIAHRVVWGAAVFTLIAWRAGALAEVRAAFADRKTLAIMGLSGVLLVVNWSIFVAAVAAGHVLEASLGYFFTPLVSVALGTIVLGERLRPLAWIAIGCGVISVAVLTWRAGSVPWISLALAVTFGMYGLVRKVARIGSLAGSTLETLLVVPLALGFLVVLAIRGQGQLGHAPTSLQLLLLSTGPVTALPLLLFTSAARRLPLSTIGFLQYLTPIGQLVLAVVVYHETFSRDQQFAFAAIGVGLVAFSIDLSRRTQPVSPAGSAGELSRTGR